MGARRVVARSLVCVCVLVGALWVLAGSAWAGFTHNLAGEFMASAPESAGSIGIAVEQLSGDVYVVDSNANMVRKFDSAGSPIAGWELEMGAVTGPSEHGFSFPYGVAVDQSTGDVYVADFSNGAVDKFDASGKFLLSFTGSGTPAGFFNPAGLATDSSGDVYVADPSNGVIDKFDSTGGYLASFSGEGRLSGTNGVAVDASGDIYASAGPLIELDSSGACVNSCTPLDESSLGVGIDPVSGHVYSADYGSIAEYSASGVFIDRFGEGHVSSSFEVAVNGSLGQIYASNLYSQTIDIFGPAVVIPDVTTGTATSVTTSTATLTGTVNPDGIEVSSCRFEYSTPPAITVGSAPCQANPGSGSEPVQVSATVTGLNPNTTYSYRLIASNENGTVDGAYQSFTTLSPPLVDEQWVTNVSTSAATVNAKINPKEYASSYYVEYGTDTSYGMRMPAADAALGSANQDVQVSQILTGLTADTVYHYRFVASSTNGTTQGPDKTFKTFANPVAVSDACPNAQIRGIQSAQYLPDCRAYELVSPADKEGGNVSASPFGTRASTDGNAIQYVSEQAFGDAYGTGSVSTEYIAERSPEGWATHAITPPQAPPVVPTGLGNAYYMGDFSPDLNKGIFYAASPVTNEDPNVVNVQNLYLRSDLLTPGHGSYRLLTGCPACLSTGPLPRVLESFPPIYPTFPALAGASEDFSHVIFETNRNLTPDATGSERKLYESVNGVVSLVGILPDSACETPPCPAEESLAGTGAGAVNFLNLEGTYTSNTISADGSRVIFTGPPIAAPGELGFGPGWGWGGNLYLRENGKTVQVNASERSASQSSDPAGWQPVRYMGASRDDSKIFFVTKQALTDEDPDPANGQAIADLYVYDANAPADHHLKLITNNEAGLDREAAGFAERAGYVTAVSEGGNYVYFLTGGIQTIQQLYVWHDGVIRHIANKESSENWGEEGIKKATKADQFRATSDGKYAVFASYSRQTAASVGYDNGCGKDGLCAEVYLYNYDTNHLTCVSCDPDGERPAGDSGNSASIASYSADTTVVMETQHLTRPLTVDGSKVFFDTPDALVRQDTNGKRDVYEYDVATGKLSLISSGHSTEDSFFVEASPSGNDVFFVTAEQLVRAEIDGNFDLYDARVDGGIEAQNVGAPAACESDDCQGPAKSAPVLSLPSSLTFAGAGNPASSAGEAVVRGKARHLGAAQRFRRAWRACQRKHGRRRRTCERALLRQFVSVKPGKRASRAARGR